MACEYCDFKVPENGGAAVGKPIVKRRDEYYTDYIRLAHYDGARCCPPMDIDQYVIEWENGGRGFYAEIDYCPKCGRKLGDAE